MRLFRSKNPVDRKGSLDSNYPSKTYSKDIDEQPTRRKSSIGRLLKLKGSSVDTPRVQITAVPSRSSTDPNWTKKQQRNDFPTVDMSQVYARDKQTGEQVIDHTDMLHSLVQHGSTESVDQIKQFNWDYSGPLRSGEVLVSKLPMKLWVVVFDRLSLADRVSVSLASKAFRQHLISSEAELELSENAAERADLLLRLDSALPNHLYCFACEVYHPRLNPRKESLKPTNVANPVFECPHTQTLDKRISRVRLTSGRTLPFTFVQLALRAYHYSPEHGISLDSLSRRWRDRDSQWNHQTRYAIINNHLLVRVVSTSFAAPNLPPAGLRNLLYNSQEEFNPYFSTCPHWRDGELMPVVKCAISHIPKPIEGEGIVRLGREVQSRLASPKGMIVTLCGDCRPIRRCPECPTEYLTEIKMAEDRAETDPTKTFKQALVVTRWSDLGDGVSPTESKEWGSCTGDVQGFDSFAEMGKRSINGMFESHFNPDVIPGQRVLNMNPNKEKLGESGHNWY